MKAPVTIKRGSVTVKIYGDGPFTIAYYDAAGERVRLKRTAFKEAKEEAEIIAAELAGNFGVNLDLTPADKASYQRALENLRFTGKSLELATNEFAEAVTLLLPGATLKQAVEEYNARHSAVFERKTAADLIEPFIESLRAQNLSGTYIKNFETRLKVFARHFQCAVHEITAVDFNNWLSSLKDKRTGKPLEPGGKATYRVRIGTFFASAIVKKHLPKKWDVKFSGKDSDILRPKVVRKKVVIYTPEQMKTLLYAAAGYINIPTPEAIEKSPSLKRLTENLSDKQKAQFIRRKKLLEKLVPYLAIGAFGATRNSHDEGEIAELDWTDIDFEGNQICIDNGTGKVGDRYIPMPPNLRAWLLLFKKDSGPILPPVSIIKRRKTLCKLTGIDWIPNGLRKSFISYRIAQTGDAAKVASDAGNSPGVIYSRYRKAIPKELGERWFNIFPPDEKLGETPKENSG